MIIIAKEVGDFDFHWPFTLFANFFVKVDRQN